MSSKKIIKDIKTNIERTVQGLTTKKDEFLFENSQTIARKGITYSIYYTLTKEKKYLTGLISSTNQQNQVRMIITLVKYEDILHKRQMITLNQYLKYQKVIMKIKTVFMYISILYGKFLVIKKM